MIHSTAAGDLRKACIQVRGVAMRVARRLDLWAAGHFARQMRSRQTTLPQLADCAISGAVPPENPACVAGCAYGGGGQVFLAGKVLVQAGFCNATRSSRSCSRSLFGQQLVDGQNDGIFPGLVHHDVITPPLLGETLLKVK